MTLPGCGSKAPPRHISEEVATDLAKLGQRLTAVSEGHSRQQQLLEEGLPDYHAQMAAELAALAVKPPWESFPWRHRIRWGSAPCSKWEALFAAQATTSAVEERDDLVPEDRELWNWAQTYVWNGKDCGELDSLTIGDGADEAAIRERIDEQVRHRLSRQRALEARRARFEYLTRIEPETARWLGVDRELTTLRELQKDWHDRVEQGWQEGEDRSLHGRLERSISRQEKIVDKMSESLERLYVRSAGASSEIESCDGDPWCWWSQLGERARHLYELSESTVRIPLSDLEEQPELHWVLQVIPNQAWSQEISAGIRLWDSVRIERQAPGVLMVRRQGTAKVLLQVSPSNHDASAPPEPPRQELDLEMLTNPTWEANVATQGPVQASPIDWRAVTIDVRSLQRLLRARGLPGYLDVESAWFTTDEAGRPELRYRMVVPELAGRSRSTREVTLDPVLLADRAALLAELARQGRDAVTELVERLADELDDGWPRGALAFLSPANRFDVARLEHAPSASLQPTRLEVSGTLEGGAIPLPVRSSWLATGPSFALDRIEVDRQVERLAALAKVARAWNELDVDDATCRAHFQLAGETSISPYAEEMKAAWSYFRDHPRALEDPSTTYSRLRRKAPLALQLMHLAEPRFELSSESDLLRFRFTGTLPGGLRLADISLDSMGFERGEEIPSWPWSEGLDPASRCGLRRWADSARQARRVETALEDGFRVARQQVAELVEDRLDERLEASSLGWLQRRKARGRARAELKKLSGALTGLIWRVQGEQIMPELAGLEHDLSVGRFSDGTFEVQTDGFSPAALGALQSALERRLDGVQSAIETDSEDLGWVQTASFFGLDCDVEAPRKKDQSATATCPAQAILGGPLHLQEGLTASLDSAGAWRPHLTSDLYRLMADERAFVEGQLQDAYTGLGLRADPVLTTRGLRLALRYQPPGYPFPADFEVNLADLGQEMREHLGPGGSADLAEEVRKIAATAGWNRRILGLEASTAESVPRVRRDDSAIHVTMTTDFPLAGEDDFSLPLEIEYGLTARPDMVRPATTLVQNILGNALEAQFNGWPIQFIPAEPFVQLDGGTQIFIHYRIDFARLLKPGLGAGFANLRQELRNKILPKVKDQHRHAKLDDPRSPRLRDDESLPTAGEASGCGPPLLGGLLVLHKDKVELARRIQASWPCRFPLGPLMVRDPWIEYDFDRQALGGGASFQISSLGVSPLALDLRGWLVLSSPVSIEGRSRVFLFDTLELTDSQLRLEPGEGSMLLKAGAGRAFSNLLVLEGGLEIETEKPWQIKVEGRDANVRAQGQTEILNALEADLTSGMAWKPWSEMQGDPNRERSSDPLLWGRGELNTPFVEINARLNVYLLRNTAGELGFDPEIEFIGQLVLPDGTWVPVSGHTKDGLTVLETETMRGDRPVTARLELASLASLTSQRLQEALLENASRRERPVEPLEVSAPPEESAVPPEAPPPPPAPPRLTPFEDTWRKAWSEGTIVETTTVQEVRTSCCCLKWKFWDCAKKKNVKKRVEKPFVAATAGLPSIVGNGPGLRRKRVWFRQSPQVPDYLLTLDNSKRLKLYRKVEEVWGVVWQGSTDHASHENNKPKLELSPVASDDQLTIFWYRDSDFLVAVESGDHLPVDPARFALDGRTPLTNPAHPSRLDPVELIVAGAKSNVWQSPRVGLAAAALRRQRILAHEICTADESASSARVEDSEGRRYLYLGQPAGRRFVFDIRESPQSTVRCSGLDTWKRYRSTLPDEPARPAASFGRGTIIALADATSKLVLRTDSHDTSGALHLVDPEDRDLVRGRWRLVDDDADPRTDSRAGACLGDVLETPRMRERLTKLLSSAEAGEDFRLALACSPPSGGSPRFAASYSREGRRHVMVVDGVHRQNRELTAPWGEILTFWERRHSLFPEVLDRTDYFETPWPFLETLARGDWQDQGWQANPEGSLASHPSRFESRVSAGD